MASTCRISAISPACDALQDAITAIGLPCILKTRRLGYDGKGQFRIKSHADIEAAWQALGAQAQTVGLILEAFVPFEREISVLAVRGRDGEFRHWALTENWHEQGVLSASLSPATDSAAFEAEAVGYARKVAEELDYVGVFALELFLHGGRLMANEMAPRVHNSGHWTIEGAETSQFQNHLRAVLGLPLGSTRSVGVSCMLNWIGAMPDSCCGIAGIRRSLARLRQGAARRPQSRPCHRARRRFRRSGGIACPGRKSSAARGAGCAGAVASLVFQE